MLVIYCLLFALFGIVEFLIMFSGATLFNNQINLIQVAFHIGCQLALIEFMSGRFNYEWLLPICAATSFVPLLIEVGSAVSSNMNYRRARAART